MIVEGRLVLYDSDQHGWLEIAGTRIAAVGRGAPPQRADLRADWIAPGFLDLQVNGGAGFEVTDGIEALRRIDAVLLREGVTGYLPTVITTDVATMTRAVRAVAELRAQGGTPAIGVHLEGPFLSPHRPGVHRLHLLRCPADGVPACIFDPQVQLVTLAPELPGAPELTAELARQDVAVSIGHSVATPDEAEAAQAAGARMVTHLFNAMTPFHHREPGLAGWALGRSDLALGLIADGQHVHPDALGVVTRAALHRTVLVSDASVGALAPPGRYRQSGIDVVRHPDGRVTALDSGLAGSGTSVADGVRMLARLGVDPAQALRSATWRPAAVLGREDLLTPGAAANLVLLDASLSVESVLFEGVVVRS